MCSGRVVRRGRWLKKMGRALSPRAPPRAGLGDNGRFSETSLPLLFGEGGVTKLRTARRAVPTYPVEGGGYQAVSAFFALGLGCFQVIAKGHQFVDLGYDSVLFGEGGERDW